jgi:hypothetical protein
MGGRPSPPLFCVPSMFDRALVQNQRCRRKWGRYARRVCGSWRMDETYVKVRGEWVYLYRAVDKAGKTVAYGPKIQLSLLPRDFRSRTESI